MKKALKYALAGLVTLIVLLLITASLQPTQWSIERSTLIKAPREKVWTIVSDLNRYNEWNSFAQMDPAAKTTVEGPAATVGSTYAWDGQESGAGKMTTTTVIPGQQIDFKLEFLRPVPANNAASFIVQDEAGLTKMTWVMNGKHEGIIGLISRAMHLCISIDSMLGGSFESGLAVLKEIAEKE
ncbi:MAG TPA: SRPBCC family protein [Oligoflexus sp.]|uniref:SRPBCC family protein n=1 Tax=Oligoflexus sp. TaxID=1971216 RepID=UPI002D383CB3|nr:SRPBCC family protein [Oligoflexus sp.]HYX39578.1 SRPBCC family protein [Oligoflexus sp.]